MFFLLCSLRSLSFLDTFLPTMLRGSALKSTTSIQGSDKILKNPTMLKLKSLKDCNVSKANLVQKPRQMTMKILKPRIKLLKREIKARHNKR